MNFPDVNISQKLRRVILLAYNYTHIYFSTHIFVPKCDPPNQKDLQLLKQFCDNCSQICVLTGAGVSTESGIPDYRSAEVGLYARSNKKPILYQQFCHNEATRKRYWARNYVGWPRFSTFEPNITHKILRNLEAIGKVNCVITQNVDSLHTKAQSQNIIELHGTAFKVMCLNCDKKISRCDFQKILADLNPEMNTSVTMIKPDGDVELSQEQVKGFNVPPCSNCGGILKPDIVFFGDNVSRDTIEQVNRKIKEADSLLVLGSSLSTFSGYRIILQAVEAKKPVGIISIGKTRADRCADIKVESTCSDVLLKLHLI